MFREKPENSGFGTVYPGKHCPFAAQFIVGSRLSWWTGGLYPVMEGGASENASSMIS